MTTAGETDLLLFSGSPSETECLGKLLAKGLDSGAVVLLVGELGSGKTVFARGIARGLGVTRRVTSPTYTFIAEYPEAEPPFIHMDLYRLNGVDADQDGLGLDDYLNRGAVVAVEWPENIPGRFSGDRIEVVLKHDTKTGRRLTLTAAGAAEKRALARLRDSVAGEP